MSGRRVLILGCGGAGKSTLAERIGRIAGLPVVHLDYHYWRPDWQEPDPQTWHRQVAALTEQPCWVMDGNYGGTLALRAAAADTVIFLDFPTWLCLARVMRRIARWRGRTRADMAPGCPEHLDFAFLAYIIRYRRRDRPRHLAALAGFGGRLVVLTRPRQVERLVEGLSGGRPISARPARSCSRPGLR